MIQASIKLYELSLTDVSRNNQSFRFACSSMNLILMELFWFCSYNQLRLIYTNTDLPGKVMGISTTYNKDHSTCYGKHPHSQVDSS
ncbi:hypothetical protein YC2023_085683 [Brassica napus]